MYWTGIKTYLQLRRNLRRPLESLRADQFHGLRELVEYVYRHVPFYRAYLMMLAFPGFAESPAGYSAAADDPQGALPTGSAGRNYFRSISDREAGAQENLRLQRISVECLLYSGRPHLSHAAAPAHPVSQRHGMARPDGSHQRQPPCGGLALRISEVGIPPKDFVYAADPTEKQLQALSAIDPAVLYSYASSMALLAAEVESRGAAPIHPG